MYTFTLCMGRGADHFKQFEVDRWRFVVGEYTLLMSVSGGNLAALDPCTQFILSHADS
jgi:hypothetical protein